MKVSSITPREGFLIVKKSSIDTTTDSGFEVEENSDDLLVFAEVVSSSSADFPKSSFVVFQELYAQEFRDGSDSYLLLQEDDVVGTYQP